MYILILLQQNYNYKMYNRYFVLMNGGIFVNVQKKIMDVLIIQFKD